VDAWTVVSQTAEILGTVALTIGKRETVDAWSIVSKAADILGIAACAISVCTLLVTRGIRSSMIAYVERADYRDKIDDRIADLESYRKLLVDRTIQEEKRIFFSRLAGMASDISIEYETILPKYVLRRTKRLKTRARKLAITAVYSNKDIERCISLLGYIIIELKKEKAII